MTLTRDSADTAGAILSPETALSERAQAMVDYWNARRRVSGLLPARRDIDPVDIPKLLRGLWLVEPIGDPPRFRCRLYGTGLVDWFGADLTGRFLDEAAVGFEGSAAETDFRAIVADGRPRVWRGQVSMAMPRGRGAIEVVMLPLAADGATVDMILVYCATV